MHSFRAFTAIIVTSSILLSTAAEARRSHSNVDAFGNDHFSNSAKVSDSELSKQRGKFITSSGLTIDFALQTRVLVDGITQNDITISSNAVNSITDSNLQRIVQIGQGNTLAALDELQKNPNVVTVIQNSQDDRVIQTLNQLDLTVGNFQSFKEDQTLGGLNYQQVISLQ